MFSLLLLSSIVFVIFIHRILKRPTINELNEVRSGRQAQLSECPSSFAYLNDRGRMGNKFFEYLSARLFAEALKLPLSVNPELLALFQKYFDSFKPQTFDFKQSAKNCNIFKDDISELYMKDLDQLKKGNHSGQFVRFLGNLQFLTFFYKKLSCNIIRLSDRYISAFVEDYIQ